MLRWIVMGTLLVGAGWALAAETGKLEKRPHPLLGRRFPEVTGESLARRKVTLPDAAKGRVTVIIAAFARQAQGRIDTWARPLLERYGDEGPVRYYELPMISGWYSWMSGFIDGGMRRGVPKPLHDNVVTYYGSLDRYFEAFDVTDKGDCYLFVLDGEGIVRHTARGPADLAGLEALYREIDRLVPPPSAP
jgi:hypothetical protein